MKKSNKIIYGLVLALISGCSSQQVKKIDTEVDAIKGNTSSGLLALKDGKAIIQKETNADDELRVQQFHNNDLENEVNDHYYELKRCRKELSDSRLGGNGQVTPLPEIDNMKTPDAIKEEFGLNKDNGNLVFVKREEFLQKLNNERNYETSLKAMLKVLKPMRDKCELEEGQARVKAGLPAGRYQGVIEISKEGNISKVIQKHENSLDDAFEIKNAKK